MRKITFTSILLGFALLANAQTVYLNETFEGTFEDLGYTVSTSWAPAASEWSCLQYESTAATAPFRVIEATPLTYSNTGGEYILSGVGRTLNSSYSGGSGNFWHTREFSSTGLSQFYVSFLIRLKNNGGSSTTLLGFQETYGTGAANRPLIARGKNGSAISFRVSANNTTGILSGATLSSDADLDETFFVVAYIDAPASTISLWVNPEIGSSIAPAPYVTDTQATMKTGFKYLYLRANGGTANYFKMSGIRVSDSWATAVAAKPEVTNLNTSATNDPVVATKYYNLQGQLVDPTTGVYIVKQIYASGKTTTTKQLK